MTDDWIRVLGKDDVPKHQWRSKGIWPKRPLYGLGKYNNSLCHMRENEKNLFGFRDARYDPPINDSANLIIRYFQVNKDLAKNEMFKFCDQKIQYTKSTIKVQSLPNPNYFTG